jgi:two-component system chemotaxis response regulator CheB
VAGLLAIRAAGGIAVVQDPEDAFMAVLPRSAINIAGADYILRLADMPALLDKLVRQGHAPGGSHMTTDPIDKMPETVDQDMRAQASGRRRGLPSVYSCPECSGVLWQVDQEELTRFRCHVGHVYYAEQLLDGQAEALEAALWTAARIFREQSTLSRQLCRQQRDRGDTDSAARYEEQAAVAERHGSAIEEILLNKETGLFPPAANGPTRNGPNVPSSSASSTAASSTAASSS